MQDWFDHILFGIRTQPESSAMLMEDRVITYGMLGNAMTSCARRMAGLDLPPDPLVAVCIDDPIRHMTVSLALFSRGIRTISLELAHKDIAGLGYAAVLGDRAAAAAFASGGQFTEVTDDWFSMEPSGPAYDLSSPFAGERTVCRYSLTSGSTGAPKLVEHTVGGMGRSVCSAVGFPQCGLILCMPGLGTIFGFRAACGVLASRKTVCFAESPYQALRMIDLFGIDMLYAATEQLVALVRVAKKTGAHLRSLRMTVVAGGSPTRALLEGTTVYLCKDLVCRYATSELGQLAEAPVSKVLENPGLVGYVLPGFEMAAFRANGEPCEPGEIGIVKARVKPNPDRGEDPWTDHGDVGWVTAGGEVFVVGRTADIGPRGFASATAREVAPAFEIEHLLRLEWDATDAAAVIIEPESPDAAREIWVATVDCTDADASRFEQILRRRGIDGSVRLVPVAGIPRGTSGKIQRAQLRSMIEEIRRRRPS